MYKPIKDYGIIGDMHSAALVSNDGSIDWCCLPRFDSPSVFAALLDKRNGGHFQISPRDKYDSEQSYDPDTNILTTNFRLRDGAIQLTDYMPCFMKRAELKVFHEIHRRIYCLNGEVTIRVFFKPKLNYARGKTEVEILKNRGCVARNGREVVTLASDVKLHRERDAVVSEFVLRQAERKSFIVSYGDKRGRSIEKYHSEPKLTKTRNFWVNWVRRCRYGGRWREHVIRSALLLKMLIYDPTGALVAAPTTSLPEQIGGPRNWDYRCSWIRDSIFALWSLHLLGYGGEGQKYIRRLRNLCKADPKNIRVVYSLDFSLDAQKKLDEGVLANLEGYNGSTPVRIGNRASTQTQHDTYGIVVDAIYFLHRYRGVSKKFYKELVRPLVNFVCDIWGKPGQGIWELRTKRRHFVHSDFWCWVALDRGIRMARELGYDEDVQTWLSVKKRIKRKVLRDGWSSRKMAFTAWYGSNELDAANLLMPLVKFLPVDHPKMTATIERTIEELAEDGLLYRYKFSDGLKGQEGTFTVCSFWLVDCLTKQGRLKEAKQLFEQLLDYTNHLGLYSEEIDPATGGLLGNFPQAYVHMALINSAMNLDRVLPRRR